jgi:hypothetical protein
MHNVYLQMQQTPYPDAHDPLLLPANGQFYLVKLWSVVKIIYLILPRVLHSAAEKDRIHTLPM